MEEYLELFSEKDITSHGQRLTIDGVDYTLSAFRKEIFNILNVDSKVVTDLLFMEKKDTSKFNTVTKTVFQAIKNELKPSRETSLENSEGLQDLTPVTSMREDTVLLINEGTQFVTEVNYKSWLRTLPIDVRKMVINDPIPMAEFFFDPYNPDLKIVTKDTDGGAMTHINTYIKPKWMKNAEASKKCPEVLDQFMKHLLPNAEQREYCLQWMAEAIFGRNETYLVLNGDKGVGKNTIYEIMKAVVGARYSVTAPASLTTSHFNSVLMNKRLILLDEYKITRSNHLFLKKIINKNQTIEKKGFDADTEIETFNSFMVFHNSVSDMYVEKDDRRFSVLDITHKNLTAIWTPDYIHELMVDLNDPSSEITKAIGQYLMYIFKAEFNNVTPFKGEKFHEIVEYHMPTWLQIVVAMVENGEVKNGAISFKKEIEKRLSNEMMGKKKIQWRKSTLQKTLKEYRYKDQWVLGEITSNGTGGSLQLEINKELLEEFGYEENTEDDFGLEDDDLL